MKAAAIFLSFMFLAQGRIELFVALLLIGLLVESQFPEKRKGRR